MAAADRHCNRVTSHIRRPCSESVRDGSGIKTCGRSAAQHRTHAAGSRAGCAHAPTGLREQHDALGLHCNYLAVRRLRCAIDGALCRRMVCHSLTLACQGRSGGFGGRRQPKRRHCVAVRSVTAGTHHLPAACVSRPRPIPSMGLERTTTRRAAGGFLSLSCRKLLKC
jgi:hypothetical protein